MALVRIQDRKYFINVNTCTISKVSNGRWEVTCDRNVADDGEVINEGWTFTVIGGRHSGGASNEWFCHCPRLYGDQYVPCKSMVQAVRLGASY